MVDSQSSNIKQFIRSGKFSKRLNLNRPRAPEPSLSTIHSAGSDEEDGNSTDIEDFPEEKNGVVKAVAREDNAADGSESTNNPQGGRLVTGQRPLLSGVLSNIANLANRRSNTSRTSTASRSSRTSMSTRSSIASSTGGLPTITEIPPLPGLVSDHGSLPPTSEPPSTPPLEDHIMPVIPPHPGFTPVQQCDNSDTHSQGSTLVGSPPRHNGNSQIPPYSISDVFANSPPPPMPSWPLPSDTMSEKSGKSSLPLTASPHSSHSFASTPAYSPPSYCQPFGDSNAPGSRFSWHVTPVDRARNWFTIWFVEWWAFEIISWLFSAVCMAIILGVLFRYNNKEIPHWRIGFTLNAFISILSGFAKSALLLPTAEALGQLKWNWFTKKSKAMLDFEVLDSASRGPWGSMVLLARTKGVTLASVGAAIILLSLPLDLFFQQIVQYPNVMVALGNSTLTRSVYYDPIPETVLQSGSTITNPNAQMVANLWEMITAKQPLLTSPNFTCPTSQCNFQPFDTLAICSSCTAVPGLLEYGCKNATNEWMADASTDPDDFTNTTACGWYLNPPGQTPILMNGYAYNASTQTPGEILVSRIVPLRDIWTRKPVLPNATINYGDIINPLGDFIIASSPDAKSVLSNKPPEVIECAMWFCAQTLRSQIKNGQLSEQILKTQVVPPTNTGNPWKTSAWYDNSFNLTLPDSRSSSGSSVYGTGNWTGRTTLDIVQDFAPSTWTSQSSQDSTIAGKFNWRSGTPDVKTIPLETSPWITTSNVTHSVTTMAESMSAVLRRTSHGYSNQFEFIQGIAYDVRTHVQIRYFWIILPACLLLFSFVFLMATVLKSSKDDKKIGVWKNSALAVLFNGPSDDVQDRMGSQLKLGSAREKARNIRVTLD
ncbi:hypothetical protein BT63DRAFT_149242 [Microthyrium microscopicum]|uniref:Uncharacterized protein n=1 Tax=Microthyrium microscopicum TaxID=703497 RepID=A0A6A6UQJ1_9PEZI|nr:hypothetical protein BT63DRAFT_149242 [Microthyrium microscopicum]